MDKLHVGRQHLLTALRLLFENESGVSVHVLAAAAREILQSCCRIRGVTSFSCELEEVAREYSDSKAKFYTDVVNRSFNALKHYKSKDVDILEAFTDEENDHMLWVTVNEYKRATGRLTIDMQVFCLWYATLYPDHTNPTELDVLQVDHARATGSFPGDLRRHGRAEQKRLARDLMRSVRDVIAETDSHQETEVLLRDVLRAIP